MSTETLRLFSASSNNFFYARTPPKVKVKKHKKDEQSKSQTSSADNYAITIGESEEAAADEMVIGKSEEINDDEMVIAESEEFADDCSALPAVVEHECSRTMLDSARSERDGDLILVNKGDIHEYIKQVAAIMHENSQHSALQASLIRGYKHEIAALHQSNAQLRTEVDRIERQSRAKDRTIHSQRNEIERLRNRLMGNYPQVVAQEARKIM